MTPAEARVALRQVIREASRDADARRMVIDAGVLSCVPNGDPARPLIQAIYRLHDEGAPADAMSLRAAVLHLPPTEGRDLATAELDEADALPHSSDVQWWIHALRTHAIKTRTAEDLANLATASANGSEPAEVIERLDGIRARLLADGRPADDVAPLLELLDAPDTMPMQAIAGLVEMGSATMLSGPSKGWKSTTAVAVGLSVADGKQFAGRFNVQTAPVLFIDGELGARRFVRLLRRMAAGLDIDLRALVQNGLLHYVDGISDPAAATPACWRSIVRARGIGLAVLDPIISLYPGDENAAREVRAWWNAAIRPLLDEGAAVLPIHHTRKGSGFVADSAADSMRGSGDWRAACDCHIAVRSEPGDRRLLRLEVTGSRLGPEPAPFYLRVEDHNGGQRVTYAGEAQEAVGRTVAAVEAIEDLVERAGDGGLPRQAILSALTPAYAERTVEDALSLVRKRGRVEVRKAGKAAVYRRLRA